MSLNEHPFEAGQRKVIPAVLVYIRREGRVLMIHRNSPSRIGLDYHEGKWNGLGGKCDLDESPLQAARREVQEEAGLILEDSQFKPLGVIQFPNFKPHKNEDWIVFLFTAELGTSLNLPGNSLASPQSGLSQLKSESDEGSLHWVPVQEVQSLNLWPGDRIFLPWVMENQPFMGTIWYLKGQVAKHWMQKL